MLLADGGIAMNKKSRLAVFLAVATLGNPILVEAQGAYDYETFSYPGSTFDQVFGINDRGEVVGNASIDPDRIPYVWDSKTGTFTNVTPIAGYDTTVLIGTADNGVLVGSVIDGALVSGLIIDQRGTSTVFDHPDAVSFTQARGVNTNGLVVGFRDDPNDRFAPENGFIYDSKKGTFTDIVPSIFTLAQGINARGDVVGHAIFNDAFGVPDPCGSSNTFRRRGWLRTKDGAVTFFSVNGGQTSPRGITDSGTIAGFVFDLSTFQTKGFVVKLDGSQCQMISIADADLLDVPESGDFDTFVSGINNSGDVAGGYFDGTTFVGAIARPK